MAKKRHKYGTVGWIIEELEEIEAIEKSIRDKFAAGRDEDARREFRDTGVWKRRQKLASTPGVSELNELYQQDVASGKYIPPGKS